MDDWKLNQTLEYIQQACHTAEQTLRAARELYDEQIRPFYLLKPKIYADGNAWCALYGENIQEGICGFGETPEEAALAFDRAWHDKL